jgi:hypothetical protein
MLATGHSKPLARGAAKAHDNRKTEWLHYDDGFNPARGIIVAVLLSIGAWMLAWAFLFGH